MAIREYFATCERLHTEKSHETWRYLQVNVSCNGFDIAGLYLGKARKENDESFRRARGLAVSTSMGPPTPNQRPATMKFAAKKDTSSRYSISVWAWIDGFGCGELHRVTGPHVANSYEILHDVLVHSMETTKPGGAPKSFNKTTRRNTARVTKRWLDENAEELTVLSWPGKSPDLNTIENVWSIMKQELEQPTADRRSFEKVPQGAVCIEKVLVTTLNDVFAEDLRPSSLAGEAFATVVDNRPFLAINNERTMKLKGFEVFTPSGGGED